MFSRIGPTSPKRLALFLLAVALVGILMAGEVWPTNIEVASQQSNSGEEKGPPVTGEQVRAALDPDEPNYVEAAHLGRGALPHLEILIEEGDPGLVPKAVYLASLIRDRRSAALVQSAAESDQVLVRVAAAAGARNLSRPAATDVLLLLLDDDDSGVREVALQSVKPAIGSADSPPALRTRIAALMSADPEPHIRKLAREVLGSLRRP